MTSAEEGLALGRYAPLVSVVIPAHNAAPFLGECLASVASQVGPFRLDVIVVDDGSTDRTAEVARSHDGVQVIRWDENRGPSAARNAGMAAARGDLVAFLDADDLWPPGSLAARMEVLRGHSGAALVFGDCRQFDQRGPRERTQFEAGGLGARAWGSGGTVPDAYARLLADNFITTGSVLARRGLVAEAGGFADELRLVEDLDLWLRLARRHEIAWCGDVCLLRRRHGANTSRDAVAMSLAFLEVLRRQAAYARDTDRRLTPQLTMLAAREQLHLADIALDRSQPVEAFRWAARSLRTSPSLRALWRVGQAALRHLGPTAPVRGEK